VTEALGVERIDVGVREGTAPSVDHIHGRNLGPHHAMMHGCQQAPSSC
jgi:hypothetical protein